MNILIFFHIILLTFSFKSEIYRFKDMLLLYNSSTGFNNQVFANDTPKDICTLKKQYFAKAEDVLSIRSRQGFFNIQAFSTSERVLITGIGTAKYNAQLDQYQSKVKIITSCKVDQMSLIVYTLNIRIASINQTTVVQIPAGISCYPQSYNIKVQYIILQFIAGLLFILLLLVFSSLRIQNLTLKYQIGFAILFIVLPLVQNVFDIFVFFVCLIFLYKLLIFRLTIFGAITITFLAFFLSKFLLYLEVNISLYIHFILNILVLYVGFICLKLHRFRNVVVSALIFNYFLQFYKQKTILNTHLQLLISALFSNQSYACVNFSIWDMLAPLIPSVFIARSFANVPHTKNAHILLHFIIYLGMGLFESLTKMGGFHEKSLVGITLVLNIIGSMVISLIQGNFKNMVTFRDQQR